jgi:hypothetical protein
MIRKINQCLEIFFMFVVVLPPLMLTELTEVKWNWPHKAVWTVSILSLIIWFFFLLGLVGYGIYQLCLWI